MTSIDTSGTLRVYKGNNPRILISKGELQSSSAPLRSAVAPLIAGVFIGVVVNLFIDKGIPAIRRW